MSKKSNQQNWKQYHIIPNPFWIGILYWDGYWEVEIHLAGEMIILYGSTLGVQDMIQACSNAEKFAK